MGQSFVGTPVHVQVDMERRADGSVVLRNRLAPPRLQGTLPERLRFWAATQPERMFLAEGARCVSYAAAERLRRDYAERLLRLGLSVDRPLLLIGANGIDLALLMLAAMSVGIPAAIVAPGYATVNAAPWGKLTRVLAQLTPGLVIADDRDGVTNALAAVGHGALPVYPLRDLTWLSNAAVANAREVDAHEAGVGPETIAKLLFTSGSTGRPKAVINTQRMLVSNLQSLIDVWPCLRERPPVLVDWLPWSHTFGGNLCFGLALYYGGTFHIDMGKPAPGLVEHTIAAIRRNHPTMYFTVPLGCEALLPVLENDVAFAREFFGNLDFFFVAAAPLPPAVRSRLRAAATRAIGHAPPFHAGWGSTETAPVATLLYFDTPHAANLGVPLPGVDIKMVPYGGRMELRVRGPNVTPGYWRDPEATAAVFDAEGFYRIGDAGVLCDAEDPAAGILFDGRVAENFKLTSGTWVNVGALRLATIGACDNLITDAVIAGEGRDRVAVLLFPNAAACKALSTDELHERIDRLLSAYNAKQTGTSTRVARFVILDEPPSAAHDEITEKGYINQRRVLERRAEAVERLFVLT